MQELRIRSVWHEPRSAHSKKPEGIRKKIAEWYPDVARIEMFARGDRSKNLFGENKFDGWDVWGNEVGSDVQIAVK